MTIYEIMNSVVHCDDIEISMNYLLELINIIDKERYSSKLLDDFYERIWSPLVRVKIDPTEINGKKYCIETGNIALSLFIAFTIPRKKRPKQTLKELQEYAYNNLDIFSREENSSSSEKKINEVMTYLDARYDFSDRVLQNTQYKSAFLLLDINSKKNISEYLAQYWTGELNFQFFLYNLDKKKTNLVAEVFYVLALAIIMRYKTKNGKMSDEFIDMFNNVYKPSLRTLAENEQTNIMAELIAVGLMYDSPFQEYDLHYFLDEEVKKVLNILAIKIISDE